MGAGGAGVDLRHYKRPVEVDYLSDSLLLRHNFGRRKNRQLTDKVTGGERVVMRFLFRGSPLLDFPGAASLALVSTNPPNIFRHCTTIVSFPSASPACGFQFDTLSSSASLQKVNPMRSAISIPHLAVSIKGQ